MKTFGKHRLFTCFESGGGGVKAKLKGSTLSRHVLISQYQHYVAHISISKRRLEKKVNSS